MSRDFWQTIRPAIRIDRIKKSLVLEAATFNCGFTRASIYQPSSVSPIRTETNITLSNTQLTIDFWAKFLSVPTLATWDVFSLISSSAAGDLRMALTPSSVVVTIITSLNTYSFTVNKSFFNEWHRFTLTFSVTDNEVRLYVDGELEGSVTTTGNLVDNDFDFNFGASESLNQGIGYFNELALYATRKTQEAIKQISSFKGNIGVYGTNLQGYWKLNNYDSTATPVTTASVGSVNLIGTGTGIVLSTTEYAPIKFGASFIAARYRLTSSSKFSFRFPVEQPEDCTGQLCVSWEDDDGVLQRRKFWTLEGVSIAPEPSMYNGEVISTSFDLEWWNIDGQATVELEEDLTLRLSKTTVITTSYDTTPVEDSTPAADSTIAENFSMTLPATFSVQQTYTT